MLKAAELYEGTTDPSPINIRISQLEVKKTRVTAGNRIQGLLAKAPHSHQNNSTLVLKVIDSPPYTHVPKLVLKATYGYLLLYNNNIIIMKIGSLVCDQHIPQNRQVIAQILASH